MSSIYNHRQMVPAAAANRVHDYLDQIRQEYDQLSQEVTYLKMQRDEMDQKSKPCCVTVAALCATNGGATIAARQAQEMTLVQQSLAELERNQVKIKQQYEEEIMRLRREVEMLRSGGASGSSAAGQPPVPPQAPPQIGHHNSTLFGSVAPGGGPALPPQPTAPGADGQGQHPHHHPPTPVQTPHTPQQQQQQQQQSQQQAGIRRTPVDMETDGNQGGMRREGSDWVVMYNPKVPKVLNVDLVHTLAHNSVVCCVNFSHDGKYLATGCNRTAQIYDVNSGQCISVLSDDSVSSDGDLYIRSVCFSPDGKFIATGAEDHHIRIWDLTAKRIRMVLRSHSQDIYSLDYSRDGRFIVSGSGDRTARIWNTETGQLLHTLYVEDHGMKDAGVTSVAFSPDGKLVAAGSLDRMVRVWNTQTGEFIERFEGHRDSVYSVVFAPDGKHLVSGSLDRTIKMWELGRGTTPGGKPGANACKTTFSGHKDFVLSVACSPCGSWVVSGSKDRGVQFWDPRSTQTQFMLQGHKNSVISVAISPKGTMFATGSGDWRARIWSYEHSSPMAPGQ
ncbi:WD40-repeat-containing domain protein [Thamnocephalis sphaerospora]|uniref:WD40-repeat-containing domain protein n=1 Tax=Thamnocephalis sphaerospora TaxID=78915 RepID=A0A4P9XJS0_9FUNG|nr:WD40-repeat-containing domain protein [Thamnocephalis sphaerospora]|eukprot:RKP05976.1 WD40-repeat-containing domain protein [Thamnocephalis sphaerospora]